MTGCALSPLVAQCCSLCSMLGCCHRPHFPGAETEALQGRAWGPGVFSEILFSFFFFSRGGRGRGRGKRENPKRTPHTVELDAGLDVTIPAS